MAAIVSRLCGKWGDHDWCSGLTWVAGPVKWIKRRCECACHPLR